MEKNQICSKTPFKAQVSQPSKASEKKKKNKEEEQQQQQEELFFTVP